MTDARLVKFESNVGPLSKRIALDAQGKLVKTVPPQMTTGIARRITIMDAGQLALLIEFMKPTEAICLSTLRGGLPDTCRVVTKEKLRLLNGTQPPDLIARSLEFLRYDPGASAFVLLDYDSKGMPGVLRKRIADLGGFRRVLATVLMGLEKIESVERASTSAGLVRTDINIPLSGSDGVHLYILVKDGSDAVRFLKALHEKCWLAGYGWMMVGEGGQLLERSIVDRMVGGPERLAFEGAPILIPPLAQDPTKRAPIVTRGSAFDTINDFPSLTVLETAKLRDLKTIEAQRVAPERAKARDAFVTKQAANLSQRTGMSTEPARRTVEKQCDGVLLPSIVLPFDDDTLQGKTVGDILADPLGFEGATMADPVQGVPYGCNRAKVLLHPDGTPWIHSFAHGRTDYHLAHDESSVRAAVERTDKADVVSTFLRLAIAANLDAVELAELQKATAKLAGVGVNAVKAAYKSAVLDAKDKRRKQIRERREAERAAIDRRPVVGCPAKNAELIPQLDLLSDTLSKSPLAEPPMRNIDDMCTRKKMRRIPDLHAFSSKTANDEVPEGETPLPAPEQPLLSTMTHDEVAIMVERHVGFVGEEDFGP
jgi:hypothetical protein